MKSTIKTLILTAVGLVILAPAAVKAAPPSSTMHVSPMTAPITLQPQSVAPSTPVLSVPTIHVDPSKLTPIPMPVDPSHIPGILGSSNDSAMDGISNAEFINMTQTVLRNSAFLTDVKSSRDTAKTELADQGAEIDATLNDLIVTPMPSDLFPAPPAAPVAPTSAPASAPPVTAE
jgi:hypothetical protein